jgi:DNA-binding transcriptional LysR family regulator
VDLKELRSLAALSELKSISLAAGQLHLSPAAIHKQLKVLESELGVRLYEKVGRHLEMTQASEVLLPYVREILAQHDSAVFALEEWRGMKRGVVRIGAGPTISSYLLPPMIKRFRKAFPGVELLIETGNTPVLLENLGRGSIDLAVLVSSDLSEAQSFAVEVHWDFELVLVSHQAQPARRVRLAELGHSRFVLFRKGSRMEEPIDRYFAGHGFDPNVIMRFDNAEAIKAMIESGLGISMLPTWIVDKDLRTGELHLIRTVEPPLYSKIAVVSRKSRYVPQVVRGFINEARKLEWKSPRLVLPPRAEARSAG